MSATGFLRLAAGAALLLAGNGCTISRLYVGVPLRGDPQSLEAGRSTKEDVLRDFGPPTEIAPQTDGDVFIYRYNRANVATLSLQEPVFTNLFLFQYTRSFVRRDILYVLFDFDGRVRGVGERLETDDIPFL